MSYQALARKWRPKSFDEVIGQEHVVAALSNALSSERVHHAYLFTGTRGVGKTTLARIFARSLNCEAGISANSCGVCTACLGVTGGNYVDLIEVDAASRTRVDDTRELLDNVQYAPTQGRFKIYLIDEVHMLSTHSFNALLKTLEEPPGHVKFLLATTDPQKLPATILSRCIQFNLKAMDLDRLYAQLEKILTAENIPFEGDALKVLARSADGSVRDSLSLLDQAIAFGDGQVQTEQVRAMLGMIDNSFTCQLLSEICQIQPAKVLQIVADLSQRAIDYGTALDDILTTLHHIALYHVSPEAVAVKGVDTEQVSVLSQNCDAELTQLLYQIALLGKKDIALAPDPRTGFEMALLRMTSFQPQGQSEQPSPVSQGGQGDQHPPAPTPTSGGSDAPRGSRIQRNVSRRAATPASTLTEASASSAPDTVVAEAQEPQKRAPEIIRQTPATAVNASATASEPALDKPPVRTGPTPVTEAPPESVSSTSSDSTASGLGLAELTTTDGWSTFVQSGFLSGIPRELAMNMVPLSANGAVLVMMLDERAKHLLSDDRLKKIVANLKTASGVTDISIELSVESVESAGVETPSLQKQRIIEETQQAAEQSFINDPNVQELVNLFDAEIIEDSVRPASVQPASEASGN